MKTIGLIGGMSWESSIEYYRIINETVREKLGGLHSARSLMLSVDFADVETLQSAGDWETAGRLLVEAAAQLEAGGADFAVICTNTMHKVADRGGAESFDPVAPHRRCHRRGGHRARNRPGGPAGNPFHHGGGFLPGPARGAARAGGPDTGRARPGRGSTGSSTRSLSWERSGRSPGVAFQRIIEDLVARGAEGVILGCTEIGLLVKEGDVAVPLFDTTRIHAEAAVEWALAEG